MCVCVHLHVLCENLYILTKCMASDSQVVHNYMCVNKQNYPEVVVYMYKHVNSHD